MNGLLGAALAAALVGQAAEPTHHWRLTADRFSGGAFQPLAGDLPATLRGPVAFLPDAPQALRLSGDSKAKHGLDVTSDLAKAKLPTADLTAEAWVRVDRAAEWGAVVGAFQDNGPYEKGWLLGYNQTQFCFAVAAARGKGLTYLKARTHFQLGYWYHVVGTYDGKEQRIYVNGKLQGQSSAQSGPIAYPPRAHFTLGAYRDDDEHYTLAGALEEAALFAKALDAETVSRRFLARKSQFPEMDAKPPIVADWPTYLRDNQRTGQSAAPLALPLHLQWTHQPRHAPAPGWPEEAKHDYWHNKYDLEERVTYDRAFHVVGVGSRLWFASSADDRVRCLDLATGKTLWEFAAEGPVRAAPTVAGDRVFFGSDDGHAYCVAASDGALRWKTLLAPGPRRIAAHGRIVSAWPVRTDVLVDGDKAYACSGVFPSQGVLQTTLAADTGEILSAKPLTVTAQGYQERRFGKLMIATGRNPQGAFVGDLRAAGREVDRETNALAKEFPFAFVGAGPIRFAGGDGKIAAFDSETGKKLWSTSVEGRVYGLAIVGGRLIASTDRGAIHAFGPDRVENPPVVRRLPLALKPIDGNLMSAAREAAETLGPKRVGYALVLGAVRPDFAVALAQATGLKVVVREPNADLVRDARQQMRDRDVADCVTVHAGSLVQLPYADWLFNLVVSEAGWLEAGVTTSRAEALRVTRPHGSVALFSRADRVRTGPVPGEGTWTHQYGDVGNTACSNDERLQGELELQWFGEPSAREMIDRHHRAAAPLALAGRLFVPGEDRVVAVDAYNGAILWNRYFPLSRRVVIFRDASPLALDAKALYVASKDQCDAIDPETGKTLRTHRVPESLGAREWGYVARVGDALVGSAVKPGSSRRTQSAVVDRTETYYDYVPLVAADALFALSEEGAVRWTYRPKGLVPHPAIAASERALYFVEGTAPKSRESALSRIRAKDLVAGGTDVVALDLRTGKTLWRRPIDLKALGHIVYLTHAKGRLVVSGSRNSSDDKKTGKVWYDLHVLDAADGTEKWAATQNQNLPIGGDHGEQDQHPVVVGGTLYQEPYAYDLESGTKLEFALPWANRRRSGCGNLSASANRFFFRDKTTSSFDLTSGKTQPITSETRPGCWINLLPVGGLLLAPEASSGCTCNFSVQTSLGLIPKRK